MQLKTYWKKKKSDGDGGGEIAISVAGSPANGGIVFPRFAIDGPFGAPAQLVTNFSRVVLIGAGIGVTPFAAQTQSLIHRLSNEPLPPRLAIDFYFACRTLGEAAWFQDVMNMVKNIDRFDVLRVHVHITGVKDCGHSGMYALRCGQKLRYKQTGYDVFTNLKYMVKFGRPKWTSEIWSVQEKTRKSGGGQIGVFFCGPDMLASELKKVCKSATEQLPAVPLQFFQEHFWI